MNISYAMYEPTTRASSVAAAAFIERMSSWGERRAGAEKTLRDACMTQAALTGAKPLGFVSKDDLNMSVFGVVFTKTPGPGFLPAPGAITADAQKSGAKGLAYIPNITTAGGKSIFGHMKLLSAIGEERPLLKIDGIASVSVKDGKISLAGAEKTADGVRIFATPSAVDPSAPVRRLIEATPAVGAQNQIEFAGRANLKPTSH